LATQSPWAPGGLLLTPRVGHRTHRVLRQPEWAQRFLPRHCKSALGHPAYAQLHKEGVQPSARLREGRPYLGARCLLSPAALRSLHPSDPCSGLPGARCITRAVARAGPPALRAVTASPRGRCAFESLLAHAVRGPWPSGTAPLFATLNVRVALE